MIYGLIIVLLMVFRPQGLFTPVRGARRRSSLPWSSSGLDRTGAPSANPAPQAPAAPPGAPAAVEKSGSRRSSVAV
jgi:hypothetical protein